MKKCTKCLEVKDENEFYKSSKIRKDGTQCVRAICKFCTNKASDKRQKENPEKARESALKFYYKNSEKIKFDRRESWKNLDEDKKNEIKEKKRIYREENREIIQKKRKQKYNPGIQSQKWKEYYYGNREKELVRKRNYYNSLDESGKEAVRKHVKSWQERNPEKVKAHTRVYDAIRRGKLIRPNTCKICSKFCKPEAHHEDYSKPLEILWLCKNCHAEKHRKTD